MSLDEIWNRVLSKSYIADLPSDEQQKLEAVIRKILNENVPAFLSGKEKTKLPHTCEYVYTQKKPYL